MKKIVSLVPFLAINYALEAKTFTPTALAPVIFSEEKKMLEEVNKLLRETEELSRAITNTFLRKEMLHRLSQQITATGKRFDRVERALAYADDGDTYFVLDVIFDNARYAKEVLTPLLQEKNREALSIWQEFEKLALSTLKD